MILFNIAVCVLVQFFVGNISETTNSTDPAKTDYSKGDGFLTWQLKVCLVIAGLVTVIGLVLCLYIRTKAENSYAIGANVPKPLGGMPDDY